MYLLNKIVWFFCNPLTIFLTCAIVGLVLAARRRRGGLWLAGFGIAALWFFSTPTCLIMLGLPLERPYLGSQKAESLPTADAIVVLGGGISKADSLEYPDMNESADRVWHAARLWKAGKAPIVVVSGSNDLASTVPLLLDFGVPRDAIAVDDESRNTYENSRFTERLLMERIKSADGRAAAPSVLLVTSAWHMTRASGNFSKTSLRVVPAPCDFTVHNILKSDFHWWHWPTPNTDTISKTAGMAKEWLGRLARR